MSRVFSGTRGNGWSPSLHNEDRFQLKDSPGPGCLFSSQRCVCTLLESDVKRPLSLLGGIACLWWEPIQRLLFSGASDNSIIMWDIGGRKGRTLLLQGHQCVAVGVGGERIRGRVRWRGSLSYREAPSSKPHLLSWPCVGARTVSLSPLLC